MRGAVWSVMLAVMLGACSGSPASEAPNLATDTPTPGAPTASPSPLHATATSTSITRLPPERWQEWAIAPEGLSEAMLAVYRRGTDSGNNPRAFSKVGDGGISTVWFLTHYDQGGMYYDLGEYEELQATIEYFQGSFNRASQAAGRGYNTTIILEAGRADDEECQPGESPLECEVRLQRPCFALISLGTNQVWYPEVFEPEMREIIERLLEQGVIPILGTKADNLEGDQRINLILARLAYEYEVPLWNFWRAVQGLPNHGLQEDMEHLTYAEPDFGNPYAMKAAWAWRNLSALQTLEAMRQAIPEDRP